jgi:nitrous oxidase accessory protein NosD
VVPADHAAAEPATLVVDRDGVQCANADFTSIQAAVARAHPGDLIRVCPDLYNEAVVIDKPLTLKGDPDAIEAIDCFQPMLGELETAQQAVIDPPGDDFSIGLDLKADDVVVEGFVVQGATVGIDAPDLYSGYRVHHNLLRLNSLFAMDFGSEGTRHSRVDHNCIRENRYGLVSELDDDSIWTPIGPERGEWNARDLSNARIDHNSTFRTGEGVGVAGPGRRDLVAIDHNTSREDDVGIALQNSTRSMIIENQFAIGSSGFAAIEVGGANQGLEIRSNIVQGGGAILPGGGFGIWISQLGFFDVFDTPSRELVVTDNEISRAGAGILARAGSLDHSLIVGNTISENARVGINMFGTNNTVRSNRSDNNGQDGIRASSGATGNRFEQNSMHGNASVDARDLSTPGSNVWIGNDCGTDSPTGTICGVE